MRVFCVAEKPSIAKAVANHLGGNQITVRNTHNKYVKNYDFQYRFSWGGCIATMSSVIGHTIAHDFEPLKRSWTSCRPIELFDAQTVSYVDEDKKAIAKNIEQEACRAEYLFIWTDCDREGEYIGTEVREIALKANPRLTVKRARFSNVERAHILNAAQHPVEVDERQANAVGARIELDLRIGAAFTRWQTLTLKTIPSLDGMVISYGSCQFPTLGFVVDRYMKVQKFISEKFWSIIVKHTRDDVEVTFNWQRGRLFDRAIVIVLYERCINTKKAKIINITNKPTSKWRPLPLTTVELQKQGSRFLGIPSQTIMTIAESLYTKGFISYPRTETDQFDKDMDLKAIIQRQTEHPTWGAYAQHLLDGGFRQPRAGKNNDQAHPPIHPIALVNPHGLDTNDRKVYEYVTRRFLACCSEDAKGASTVVTMAYGPQLSPPEIFTASGLLVLERNYLNIYIYDKWSTNELPKFQPGEEFVPDEAMVHEGKTFPPGYLTEPELIALMDANGIGTDATMAEHIAKIIERKYVFAQTKRGGEGGDGEGAEAEQEDAGRGRGRGRGSRARGGRGVGRGGGRGGMGGSGVREFIPSNLGVALVEGYDNIGFDSSLSKPFLRKEMEVKMKQICEGRITKQQVVQESIDQYRQVFIKASREVETLKAACRKYIE